MKQCPQCAQTFSDATVFCKFCGQPLVAETPAFAQSTVPGASACPNCRAPRRAGAAFCKECGAQFRAAVAPRVTSPELADYHRELPANPLVGFLKSTPGKLFAGSILGVALIIAFWISRGVKVTLAFNPGDPQLYVDDKPVTADAASPEGFVLYLGRGRHTLRAERVGYKSWTGNLNLGFTEFSKVEKVTLEPAAFPLTVVTGPPSCRVSLDGQEKGYSDAQDGRLVIQNVSIGMHTVSIDRDGYENWSQNISVESAQMIRAQLSEIQRPVSSDESEIIGILQGWASTIEQRDLGGHMNYYADVLEKYYNLTFVSSAKVRDDRSKAFGKYDSLQVTLSNFSVYFESSDRVVAVFDKNFDFRGAKYYSGAVQNRMTLLRMNGYWRIVGEEELQIYNTNSGTN